MIVILLIVIWTTCVCSQVQPQVTAAIYEPQFKQMDDNIIITNDLLYVVNETMYKINETAVHNRTFIEQMERLKVQIARNANKLELIYQAINVSNDYLKSINDSSAETASDLSATGPVMTILTKINTVSDTISTFVETIKTTVAAVSAFTEGAQYTEAQKQSALLTRIADSLEIGFGEKVVEVISEREWTIMAPQILALQIDLDLCEFLPDGVSPINCNGMEVEGATLELAQLFPF